MVIEVLTIISDILMAVLIIYFAWIYFCDLIALFSKKKRYPPAPPSNIAVLICARNEESVIGNLLDSLNRQNYPKDKLTVFVVAHNCKDNTAKIAQDYGAVVFTRNNPEEKTKGKAMAFGTGEILKNYPGVFKFLCVFDADNIVGQDYMKEMNAAICSGADLAQGFRHSKNYHENVVTELFGAYWYQIMICQNLPHTTMGLPASISGTGFAVTMEALGKGWNTCTLLEDLEFTCQMAMQGRKCILAPYALFYDEQPVDFMIGMRQRYRWSVGAFQVVRAYFPQLVKAIPKQGAKALKMLMDILINPVLLLSLAGLVLQGVIIFLNDGGTEVLWFILRILGLGWLSALPVTLILFIKERMNPLKNIWTILLFPYFVIIPMFFTIPAMFEKNPQWKPVPHGSTVTLETLEGRENKDK